GQRNAVSARSAVPPQAGLIHRWKAVSRILAFLAHSANHFTPSAIFTFTVSSFLPSFASDSTSETARRVPLNLGIGGGIHFCTCPTSPIPMPHLPKSYGTQPPAKETRVDAMTARRYSAATRVS